MGRRRRRWREPQYLWWLGFAGVAVAAVLVDSWRLGLVDLLAWCFYELALIPTACRVATRQGLSCHDPVRGRLFACSAEHQRIKTDALWRMIGLPNPFNKRRAVSEPAPSTGVVVYSPAVRGQLDQADRTMVMVAGLGVVITLVGMVIGLFTLR
jgi:hypothetical protein